MSNRQAHSKQTTNRRKMKDNQNAALHKHSACRTSTDFILRIETKCIETKRKREKKYKEKKKCAMKCVQKFFHRITEYILFVCAVWGNDRHNMRHTNTQQNRWARTHISSTNDTHTVYAMQWMAKKKFTIAIKSPAK